MAAPELMGQGNYDAAAGNSQVIVKGARVISDNQSARRKLQFTKEVIDLIANTNPLMAFTDKLGNNKEVAQPTYFHLLRDRLPRTVTYGTSTGETTGTTLTFAAGQTNGLVAGSLLLSERTGEVILVTTVTSTTVCQVSRAFGTGSAVATTLNDAEELQIIGRAFTENSAAPSGISSEPNIITNACQTFRYSIEASGREMESENYGEDEWQRQGRDAVASMTEDQETGFIFNPAISTSDPTMSKGLLGWIATNLVNQAGPLTEPDVRDMFIRWFRHNHGQQSSMVLMIGDNASKCFESFAVDGVRYTPDQEYFGLSCAGWQTSAGKVKLLQHGLYGPLGSSVTAANKGRVGMMTGVNVKMIGKRTFKNRSLTCTKNVQLPGVDGRKDVWTEDVGMAVLSEKAHLQVYGITPP